MKREIVIKKVIEEIRDSNPAVPRDYFDMELYFGMAYAIGFNEGLSERSNRKPLLQLDMRGNVINEFCSAMQAYKQTKINRANIANVCNGRAKTAGGYKWKWKDKG